MSGINILALQKDFNQIMRWIISQELEEQRDFVRKVYLALISDLPLYTGWLRSNQRIMIRNKLGQFKTGGTPKLVPQSKPIDTPKLAFFGNIAVAVSEELQKLSILALDDRVIITTRVPYAEEVASDSYTGALLRV